MGDDEDDMRGPMRVRVQLTPQLRQRINQASDALGVPDTAVIAFALAMGVRFLDVSLVNPMTGQIKDAVDARANTEAQSVVGAARASGLPVRD